MRWVVHYHRRLTMRAAARVLGGIFLLSSLLLIGILVSQRRDAIGVRQFAGVMRGSMADVAATTEDAAELVDSGADITSAHNLTWEELDKVRRMAGCDGRRATLSVGGRGEYVVFYNYVRASRVFGCHESVTFTAPADYTFLDNLATLVERWQGPVSVALYAPGDDFNTTLRSIAYLRACLPNSRAEIRELVTFHVFFHQQHVPKQHHRPLVDAYTDAIACDAPAPYMDVKPKDTYRRRHNLLFPINVARNVARQSAQTHYVFAADIELYPSVHFIHHFLRMLGAHPAHAHGARPRIFVLPIFEVAEGAQVPDNKTALQAMIRDKQAQLFHRSICAACHAIPNLTQWLDAKETAQLDIFAASKRTGKHRVWEAFYVGTKEDPLFDERYTWEGQGNKMSQQFSMCLLDYDYMILNNAFIIHRPGIKHSKEQIRSFFKEVKKSDYMLKFVTKPMLIGIYGNRDGCYL